MVTKWGLSDRLGPLTYTEDDGEIFLGRSVTRHKQVSDVTAHAIDEEVRLLIDTCYGDAKRILETSRDKLEKMAVALLKYETLDEQQVKDIMEGRECRPPADWEEPSEPGKPPPRDVTDDKGTAPLGGPAGQH
jgi:cell division protease FtsH